MQHRHPELPPQKNTNLLDSLIPWDIKLKRFENKDSSGVWKEEATEGSD